MRTATCACGQLSVRCAGEPGRISVCHCLNCQRRSGSAFSAQARWPDACVTFDGVSLTWETVGDSGRRASFRFCPTCGTTVAYTIEALPGVTAIPLGAFADPAFPTPRFSSYEQRKHAWVAIDGEGIEHWP